MNLLSWQGHTFPMNSFVCAVQCTLKRVVLATLLGYEVTWDMVIAHGLIHFAMQNSCLVVFVVGSIGDWWIEGRTRSTWGHDSGRVSCPCQTSMHWQSLLLPWQAAITWQARYDQKGWHSWKTNLVFVSDQTFVWFQTNDQEIVNYRKIAPKSHPVSKPLLLRIEFVFDEAEGGRNRFVEDFDWLR